MKQLKKFCKICNQYQHVIKYKGNSYRCKKCRSKFKETNFQTTSLAYLRNEKQVKKQYILHKKDLPRLLQKYKNINKVSQKLRSTNYLIQRLYYQKKPQIRVPINPEDL